MPEEGREVSFRYDAPEVSARRFALDLLAATEDGRTEPDSYSLGGSVEELETAFARLLGKEKAVFMPTGTLANHLAVRSLVGGKSRVILQERGHLYNDSGDCLQRLSGINAVPLGKGRASFSLDEVREALAGASSSRVAVGVGALVIETPVRRMHGELFDQDGMDAICAFARDNGIGLHLDGARLFIASAYTGIPVLSYAGTFDTVYVSLYKYFGSPSGAILAGPARLMDGLYHERRMFGGGLNQAWILATSALRSLEGFPVRFAAAVAASEGLKDLLANIKGLTIINISNGTNVFGLAPPPGLDPEAFRARLLEAGLRLPVPESGTFFLKVNESILERPPEIGRAHV